MSVVAAVTRRSLLSALWVVRRFIRPPAGREFLLAGQREAQSEIGFAVDRLIGDVAAHPQT